MTFPPWLYGVVGAVVGSFLNVCIDRLPVDRSILSPPSHCPHCKRRLRPYELIPLISYLFLRGRCRTCKAKIPLRVPLVELGTALLFWLVWLKFGPGWTTLIYSVHIALLVIIGLIDLEHQRVLNVLIFPAILWGLISIPLLHRSQPWSYLMGGILGFGVLFLIALISSGAMGMGDVKLALFIGLIVGYPEVILTLFIAFITGGLLAGFLLLLNKLNRKDTIAFGPYLALAGVITLIYGETILNWWLRRF